MPKIMKKVLVLLAASAFLSACAGGGRERQYDEQGAMGGTSGSTSGSGATMDSTGGSTGGGMGGSTGGSSSGGGM